MSNNMQHNINYVQQVAENLNLFFRRYSSKTHVRFIEEIDRSLSPARVSVWLPALY